MKEAAKTAVFWAPNMSIGIHWLLHILPHFSHLTEMDFQIEEIQHKEKKDNPSGTALLLFDNLKKVVASLPPPLFIRGGGVFGVHKIMALGQDEVIEITHSALNRKVFAVGALRVAQWIRNKKPGFYSMADVFK